MAEQSLLRWHFGTVAFDEATLQVSLAGAPVEVERKPLEVLRHLLAHAGEVVTKDELIEAVWPGRILSDTVLAKAISRLREVLGEAGSEAIKTVHGYGYRLVAEVRLETLTPSPLLPPVLGLQVGQCPPLRPNWQLQAHLQSGGRGEVWRVQHEKTGEQRVLKFALDAAALASLKREITLNRLLRQQLGPEAPVLPLLDWNLQEAPFFIELPWLPQGSLADWAASQGGLEKLPLATRLELAAQVAEALAQCHGVGVLHKDLKPGNVLVEGSSPRLLLADFGSGAVLDGSRLDALGITRMGLTQVATDSSSGTPLYLAPEVLAGQPPTVKSDHYALGVLLYQLVVGDFKRPLSPGWEREVQDPLLREDIALAADGNPAHRLAEAGELAQRLRNLPARRSALAAASRAAVAQAEAEAIAAAAQQENARLKARRSGLLATLVVLLLGVAVSLGLYLRAERLRAKAEEAAQAEQAQKNFLFGILNANDAALEGGQRDTLTARQILDAAAKRVVADPGLPLANRAEIMRQVGALYYSYGLYPQALALHQKALALLQGGGVQGEALARGHLALGDAQLGSNALTEATRSYYAALALLGGSSPVQLRLRGEAEYSLGYVLRAQNQFKLAGEYFYKARKSYFGIPAAAREPSDTVAMNDLMQETARLLVEQGQPSAALNMYLPLLVVREAHITNQGLELASTLNDFAACLFLLGQYAEAEKLLFKAHPLAVQALGANSAYAFRALNLLAEVRIAAGRAAAASEPLRQASQIASANAANEPELLQENTGTQARHAAALGQWPAAIAAAESFLASQPTPYAQELLGRVLSESGQQPARAEGLLLAAVAARKPQPGFYLAHSQLLLASHYLRTAQPALALSLQAAAKPVLEGESQAGALLKEWQQQMAQATPLGLESPTAQQGAAR